MTAAPDYAALIAGLGRVQDRDLRALCEQTAAALADAQRRIAEQDEIIERLNKRRDEWFEAWRTSESALAQAVADERERCAKVCDDYGQTRGAAGHWIGGCVSCAAAIRALGNTKDGT